MKTKIWLLFITGFMIGILAATAQAFFRIQPPVAYGICLLGHPSGLTKWFTNNIFGTDLSTTEVFAVYPSLLVVGIFIGSIVAAYRNKELGLRPGPVDNKFIAVLFGFLVANFGLLWGSCPIRTGLLISYGSIMALIALISIAIGIILACKYVRFRVKREKYK